MYKDIQYQGSGTNPEGVPEPTPHRESKAWMVTFTDLVSLMLTFFVMLFSMSSVKVDKWDEMIDALSTTLNPTRDPSVITSTTQFNIGTIFRKRAINLDYLASILKETMAADPLLKDAVLMRLADRLVIALPGDLLFQQGRALMTEGAQSAMFSLGGMLGNVGNRIGINGHSDPSPPAGDEYASNWELSVARAAAVANALRRAGYSDDIVAYGYSDTRFGDLPEMDEEQRSAMARRVDIVVLPTGGG